MFIKGCLHLDSCSGKWLLALCSTSSGEKVAYLFIFQWVQSLEMRDNVNIIMFDKVLIEMIRCSWQAAFSISQEAQSRFMNVRRNTPLLRPCPQVTAQLFAPPRPRPPLYCSALEWNVTELDKIQMERVSLLNRRDLRSVECRLSSQQQFKCVCLYLSFLLCLSPVSLLWLHVSLSLSSVSLSSVSLPLSSVSVSPSPWLCFLDRVWSQVLLCSAAA